MCLYRRTELTVLKDTARVPKSENTVYIPGQSLSPKTGCAPDRLEEYFYLKDDAYPK